MAIYVCRDVNDNVHAQALIECTVADLWRMEGLADTIIQATLYPSPPTPLQPDGRWR